MECKKQAQTRRKKGPAAKTLKPDGSSDNEPLSSGFLRSGNLFWLFGPVIAAGLVQP